LVSEHAVTNDAVAQQVYGDSKVIVVSLEEVVVDLEVGVADIHHVLEVLNQSLISQSSFLKISQVLQPVLLVLS
jgi:hypothetical protein